MKLPVEHKVMGGFALTLLILCMISGLTYWTNYQFIQAENQLRDHQDIIKELESLLSQVKDIQTGQQDYVITGEEHHLQPYYAAIPKINQELKILRQLTIHQPQWQQPLNQLEQLINQKIDVVKKTIVLRQNQGFEAAKRQILTHQGLNLINEIRQRIEKLKSEEEYQLSSKSKQVRFKAKHTGFIILLSDGIAVIVTIVALITIHQDLQKRRQAESQLIQLAEIIQFSNDAILRQSLDGIILSWNQGAERIFGYKAGEIIGQSIFTLIPPEHHAEMAQILQRIQQGEQIQSYEMVLFNKENRRLTLLTTLSPIKDISGKIIGLSSIQHDLTYQSQVEEVRRESQALLTGIIEGSQDLIAALDLNYKFIAMNRAYQAEFLKIFGVEIQTGTRLIETLAHLPEEQAIAVKLWGRALAGEEFTIIQEFGDIARQRNSYEITYSTIRDETGRQIGASHIARNISQRISIERKLQQYERIVSATSDGLLLIDPNLIYLEANQAYLHLHQKRYDEVVGYSVPEVIGQELFSDAVQERLKLCLTGQQSQYETWFNSPTEGPQYLSVTYTPCWEADQTISAIVVNLRKITELKQVEEALRQSETRYRAILEDQTELIARFLPNGVMTFVNEAYCRYFGLQREALIGQCYEPVVVEEDREPVLKLLSHITPENPVVMIENRVIIANQIRWTQWTNRGIFDEKGLIVEYQAVGRDIQDRKQIEQALQASEERYRHIVETATEGIWEIDAQSRNTFINQRMAEMLGYTIEEMLNMSLFDVMDEQEVALASANVERRQQGIQEQHDFKFRRKDGSPLWAIVSTRPIFDSNGRYQGALGMITDISQRKQTELALQESEARFQAFMYYNPALAWIINAEGRLLYLNEAYSRIFHIPVETAIGQSTFDLFPAEYAQQYLDNNQKVIESNQVLETIETSPRPDGKIIEFLVYKFPIPNLSKQYLVGGIALDITERKKAERQLELQDIIVKNMAEGICLVRAIDAVIVYANPKFERMFGYELGELAYQSVSILNYQDETIDPLQVHLDIAHLIDIYGECSYEVHNVKKDGTDFWCRATTSRFEHPDYGIVYVAVQEDISERKQAEEKIKASLQEKEVLLREIHHRVKNNLQIIDGLLQLQYRRTQEPQAAAILLESQHRIKSIALVHEKLYRSDDLAKINFSEYIPSLVSSLLDSYNISSHPVHISMNIESILLDIDIAIPCGLIINELVSNALKHAFPETCEHREICINFHDESENTVSLTIQDNGMGLPDNFDIRKTRSLGLKLVQGLVMQLEGILKIDCQTGTEFTIFFAKGKIY
jgi:PAS domain S-box-containing protein